MRDGSLNNEWRKEVKKRDNYACQNCGITQKELSKQGSHQIKHRLHAHHIKSWADFPESRFDITNGITYCHPCHLKAENKEILVPKLVPTVEWHDPRRGKTLAEYYGEEKAKRIVAKRIKTKQQNKMSKSIAETQPATYDNKCRCTCHQGKPVTWCWCELHPQLITGIPLDTYQSADLLLGATT